MLSLQHHYDVGKRYHIMMSLQSHYVIGLYHDVNPTKKTDLATISTGLNLHRFVVIKTSHMVVDSRHREKTFKIEKNYFYNREETFRMEKKNLESRKIFQSQKKIYEI